MNTDKFRAVTDKMHASIEAKLNGAKRVVYYSAYKLDAKSVPVSNLSKVAIRGTFVVTASHDEFYGEGTDYVSRKVTNPTFLTLAVIANEAIVTTGDYHHSFFEGVRDAGNGTLRLVMGS